MSCVSPVGFDLIKTVIEKLKVEPGSKVLDIGCGDGEIAAKMQNELKLNVTGIDIDDKRLDAAKAAGVKCLTMDAGALAFDSRSFDIVLMNCVFSGLDRQAEAMNEAMCVIKPGGYLVMTDLYLREVEEERWKKNYKDAVDAFFTPREEGSCATGGQHFPSPYCLDGAIVLDALQLLLDEVELDAIIFDDRTEDLKAFLGQCIMDAGSVEEWFKNQGAENCCPEVSKKAGYFLLVAQKPNA